MKKSYQLTNGSELKILIRFMLPFLFASFMQSFYGAFDLFAVGQFGSVSAISAVSIGSQLMNIITMFVIGISMGITVTIAHSVGADDEEKASKIIGNSILFFVIFAVIITPVMVINSNNFVYLLNTPDDAVLYANEYVKICSAGLPFVIIFNVEAAMLRGMGNSRAPMLFVGVACLVNVVGDLLFVGAFNMSAKGAATATIIAQGVSSVFGLIFIMRSNSFGFFLRKDIHFNKAILKNILFVGVPVAFQDTLISVAFMFITVFANQRGLIDSSAVGVTEKVIAFMFLVPSAMLSAISAITAQNMGANKPERSIKTVKYGIIITTVFGCIMCFLSQIIPNEIISIFSSDTLVINSASNYLRSYSIDCIIVAVVFCANGYLCGTNRSMIIFIHNIVSIFAVRIPVAYLLSKAFPNTLYPMGLASPLGSLVSGIIIVLYFLLQRKRKSGIKNNPDKIII